MPRGVGHRPPEHYGHHGFRWINDLPPDYTAEELRSYLPGKNIGVKFIEWYRQDVQGRGMTVPFMKYSGPGNPTNIGEPVNEADKFAKIHDLEYAYAKYRHNNRRISDEQLKRETDAADRKFMKSNGWNMTSSMNPGEQLASMIGALGIGVKYTAESAVGQIYPSLEKDSSDATPTTSRNLANNLMKNLQSNVPKRVSNDTDAGEGSSMASKAQKTESGARVQTGISGGEADLPHKQAGGSSSTSNIPQDIEMATLTGSGKEQASGGASSEGMMVHYIEKPLSVFGRKESVYTKSHKFMTFGLAPNFCPGKAEDVDQGNVYLTSYLAEVPWHIPALYLNESEFNLIPDGSRVKSIKIEVIYRGSTIQFETNASATGLATLNQINDIAVAHGLNRTGWGSNVSMKSFNPTESMIPTAITRPYYGPSGTYVGMVADYYSGDNDSNNFVNVIPKHQTGRHAFLYNYFAQSARRGNASLEGFRQFGGWPCIAEKIKQMDGKTVVNQCVASSMYEPKVAPLKQPLRAQAHGLPYPQASGNMIVPGANTFVESRASLVNADATVPTTSSQQPVSTTERNYQYNNTSYPTFDIYTPIEKSQYIKSGFWGVTEGHVQPSVHIGVQPVPALSTAALLASQAQFNNWTDTRAYWEVVATMVVEEHLPTAWPYATRPNVPQGEVMQITPIDARPLALQDARLDGATFAGLYPVAAPSLDS